MSDFLRKYGRACVMGGVGLLLICVMFWLAPNRETEKANVSNDSIHPKPTASGKSAGHRKIGGSPFSPPAREEMEEDSDEIKFLASLIDSPKPSAMATAKARVEAVKQEGSERSLKIWQDQLAELEKLPPNVLAMHDIQSDIGNKHVRRQSKAFEAAKSQINSQEDWDDFRREEPASYNTERELAAKKALRGLQLSLEPTDYKEDGGPISYTQEPEEWRVVADYLREERDFAFDKLNNGNPENPHWWADHLEWIEETAAAMEIPLDAENEDWIDAHVSAAAQRQQARDDAERQKRDEETRQMLQPVLDEMGVDWADWKAELDAMRKEENPRSRRRRLPRLPIPFPPELLPEANLFAEPKP